jgi:DNA invertase Pin-like site-specific DNA recombinase
MYHFQWPLWMDHPVPCGAGPTRDSLALAREWIAEESGVKVQRRLTPMRKMVLTVPGMVAEMELGFIKARQRDGIERAKSKDDVYRGRKPTIDRLAVRDLFNEGIGAGEIARRLKIGRAPVYRVLDL